ncbi:hypothetical protein FF38_13625 [Lucilia cuprina]|uniref:Uncharacterized protein n=1 Tax=Lucilia cuprina TaxID=7375 RepID=A0A0L0CA65_LUCCU|nr:hypothetical protein FF38_13625 [Lucilia cuprina]
MKLFQIIFIVASVIAVVSCNPGNNAMDGNGNAMNKQTISDGRFCAVCGN